MIGHNQASFDQIVEENLLRGLYLAQLDAIVRAVEDPRLSPCALRVLCQIIKRTNTKTGMAYPGRARLASDIIHYIDGEARRYSEASIAKAISELLECGYIVADKRAPEGRGRALSHYATTAPSIEDLQQQIAEWCTKIQGQPKRRFPTTQRPPDGDTRGNVDAGIAVSAQPTQNRPDGDTRLSVSVSDGDTRGNVDAGIAVRLTDTFATADGETGIRQELVEGTGKKNSTAARAKRSKLRTQLSPDWKPAPETVGWVRANFVASDQQIAEQADQFRDFHIAKGSLMADWPAAWRTWWGNGYHRLPKRGKATPLFDGDVERDRRRREDEAELAAMQAGYQRRE